MIYRISIYLVLVVVLLSFALLPIWALLAIFPGIPEVTTVLIWVLLAAWGWASLNLAFAWTGALFK